MFVSVSALAVCINLCAASLNPVASETILAMFAALATSSDMLTVSVAVLAAVSDLLISSR